eukprot:jgi/Galph1/2968/GphlegSOOS_G1597.1
MFTSTSSKPLSATDIEREEALATAKECLASFSHQALLGLKFSKTPEEIERDLMNVVTQHTVKYEESQEDEGYYSGEENSYRYSRLDTWSDREDDGSSSRTRINRGDVDGVSEEHRVTAASHLYSMLRILHSRKFPRERIVVKVNHIHHND